MPFPKELNVKQLNKVPGGIFPNWDSRLFGSYLERFGLPQGKKIGSFSRGMQMKLSMAAAMSHSPQLLVLDEPTGGLDPVMRAEILDLLLEFMQDESHSILISTHITIDLEHIADYIGFIHRGRLKFCQERNELIEKHRILKSPFFAKKKGLPQGQPQKRERERDILKREYALSHLFSAAYSIFSADQTLNRSSS